MKRFIFIFLLLPLLSCAKVQYLDEALRLKAYSEETDARDAMIAKRQAKVAALLERIVRGDSLIDLKMKADLLTSLDEPVLIEPLADGFGERWLYRDPVKYFNVPKVYFVVDQQGQVKTWTSVGVKMNTDAHKGL